MRSAPLIIAAFAFAASVAPVHAAPVRGGNSALPPNAQAPVIQVQTGDAFRVNQLEEQVRQLNGKVEELMFQLLQMQEQLRKQQEDNEFRFQEIEDKLGRRGKGGSGAVAGTSKEEDSLGKSEPSDSSGSAQESDGTNIRPDRKSIEDLLGDQSSNENGPPRTLDGVELFDPEKHGRGTGAPPAPLGSLIFDENGKVVDGSTGDPTNLLGNLKIDRGSIEGNPDEMFDLGYQYLQGGQYDNAAQSFGTFIDQFPDDPRVPEALFWEGESFFAMGDYEEAARLFLKNHKTYPRSKLGAENLLKLGVSLAGLDQRELACATYAEVPKKYPDISRAVRSRLQSEQASAKCVN